VALLSFALEERYTFTLSTMPRNLVLQVSSKRFATIDGATGQVSDFQRYNYPLLILFCGFRGCANAKLRVKSSLLKCIAQLLHSRKATLLEFCVGTSVTIHSTLNSSTNGDVEGVKDRL